MVTKKAGSENYLLYFSFTIEEITSSFLKENYFFFFERVKKKLLLLAVAVKELINTTCSVDELVLTSVEWV